MQALARLKLGDASGALRTLDGVRRPSVRGRLCHALTLSGAAAIGFGDPGLATTKAAESRQLALQLRDAGALVEASWAQALAAHSRGDLRGSLRADLRETHALPELAMRVLSSSATRWWSGAHMAPTEDVTRSNRASPKGRFSASPSAHSSRSPARPALHIRPASDGVTPGSVLPGTSSLIDQSGATVVLNAGPVAVIRVLSQQARQAPGRGPGRGGAGPPDPPAAGVHRSRSGRRSGAAVRGSAGRRPR